jgi:hypothetical protein
MAADLKPGRKELMARVWACDDNYDCHLWTELPIHDCEELLSVSPVDHFCTREQSGSLGGKAQGEPDLKNVFVEVLDDEAALKVNDNWKPGIYRCAGVPKRYTIRRRRLEGRYRPRHRRRK